MWLRIRVAGKEVKSRFTQFVSVFVVRGVEVFDCSVAALMMWGW